MKEIYINNIDISEADEIRNNVKTIIQQLRKIIIRGCEMMIVCSEKELVPQRGANRNEMLQYFTL